MMYSVSILIIISWCVFSFLFWKKMRSQAVLEERIFDIMFYSTLVSFVAARAGFVLTHLSLFSDSIIKVIALWVEPGLSFYAGFVGLILTLLYLGRRYKIRVGLILDAVAVTFPWALGIGAIGFFIPESIVLFCIGIIMVLMERRANKQKWPYGLVSIWFFIFFSASEFVLEFFKESTIYYGRISANGWVLVAIFAEALGAFYVRGGGREKVRPILAKLYAKFSKRHNQ